MFRPPLITIYIYTYIYIYDYIYIYIYTRASSLETDPAEVPVGSLSPRQKNGGATHKGLGNLSRGSRFAFTTTQMKNDRRKQKNGDPSKESRGGAGGQSDLRTITNKTKPSKTEAVSLPFAKRGPRPPAKNPASELGRAYQASRARTNRNSSPRGLLHPKQIAGGSKGQRETSEIGRPGPASAEATQLQFAERCPKPPAMHPPSAYLGRASQVSLDE